MYSPDDQLACGLDVTHEGWHEADGSRWYGGQWAVSSYDDTQAAPTLSWDNVEEVYPRWVMTEGDWTIPAEDVPADEPLALWDSADYSPPPSVPPPWGEQHPELPGVVAAVPVGGCNHAQHAIATLLTCGLWWPIWIAAALFGRRRMLLVDSHGEVVATKRI